MYDKVTLPAPPIFFKKKSRGGSDKDDGGPDDGGSPDEEAGPAPRGWVLHPDLDGPNYRVVKPGLIFFSFFSSS